MAIGLPIKTVMKGLPIALPQDDLRYLKYIEDTGVVVEPSTETYNLKEPERNPSMGQGQFIQQLFNNQVRF